MSLVDLQRQLAEKRDLEAIPQMSPEERTAKLAEYQATVAELAEEEGKVFAALPHSGSLDSEMAIPDLRTLQSARALMARHRSAQKSLERIQGAIAKAEKAQRRSAPQITFEKQQQQEQE